MKSTTPNDLAAAISLCSSSSEIQQKAKALAEELAKEDGAKRLVEEAGRAQGMEVDGVVASCSLGFSFGDPWSSCMRGRTLLRLVA